MECAVMECALNEMYRKLNCYLISDTVIFGMQKEFNARHDDKEVFYQISFYPLRNANL